MSLSEFDIIERYFGAGSAERSDVQLGVGDDAAVVSVPPARQVVTVASTLLFEADAPAERTGHMAMARALNRLAASGARPAWAILALTLEAAREPWLEGFSGALLGLARRHGVALIGGDITHGHGTVTVFAHGLVPAGGALGRDGARPGDRLYVTGSLARLAPDAGLDTAFGTGVEPAVSAGCALRGVANAANDLAGGLVPALVAVLEASRVGATVELARLPLGPDAGAAATVRSGRTDLAAVGGLELCLAVRPARQRALEQRFAALDRPCTRVGVIEAQGGLRCFDAAGRPIALPSVLPPLAGDD